MLILNGFVVAVVAFSFRAGLELLLGGVGAGRGGVGVWYLEVASAKCGAVVTAVEDTRAGGAGTGAFFFRGFCCSGCCKPLLVVFAAGLNPIPVGRGGDNDTDFTDCGCCCCILKMAGGGPNTFASLSPAPVAPPRGGAVGALD